MFLLVSDAGTLWFILLACVLLGLGVWALAVRQTNRLLAQHALLKTARSLWAASPLKGKITEPLQLSLSLEVNGRVEDVRKKTLGWDARKQWQTPANGFKIAWEEAVTTDGSSVKHPRLSYEWSAQSIDETLVLDTPFLYAAHLSSESFGETHCVWEFYTANNRVLVRYHLHGEWNSVPRWKRSKLKRFWLGNARKQWQFLEKHLVMKKR